MPSTQVCRFRRSDRDQLTDLVNAHAAAVVPGADRLLRCSYPEGPAMPR